MRVPTMRTVRGLLRTTTGRVGTGVALAALASAALASCDKHVSPVESLPVAPAASLDANAGAWRMLVLTGPDQMPVAAPDPVGSAAYAAQLDSVRQVQAGVTDADRRAVAYWDAGGVLRWNEIERELTARFNLPPAPGAAGTYPIPSAANPFGYPQFPFANPPYAARAYSYVAVAQYEALKAAWFAKFRYGRAAPGVVDAKVGDAAVAAGAARPSALPAYPSEAAVLAGVSSEMLKLLFPAAVDDIAARAAEEQRAALVAGTATPSDLAAGTALGRAVAATVIARAKADGMGQAVGTPALWQALTDSATARGEVAWVSQEAPARPPMLPNFGSVKAWTLTSAQVDSLLPPAPPSASSPQMAADLAEVKRTVANLTRNQLAVAQRWNDGAGTYTPPGHWNEIAAAYVSGARMSEVRAARTFALLNMAMHDAAVGCWRVKYRYVTPRPAQLDPSIKTVIGLPNFPSYPSGHSTFSAAAAEVLGHVFPSAATTFEQQADEAGISRLYGGIHYRTDITNGKLHGQRIGAAVVRLAQGDGAEHE
ncbi:MAG TPA: phosphatase PAP2 family protein [Gemmatirosa sp.]